MLVTVRMTRTLSATTMENFSPSPKIKGVDHLKYSRRKPKVSETQSLYEIRSDFDPVDFSDFEAIGLGEKFNDTMKKHLDVLHQVEPFSNLLETCGSVRNRAFSVAEDMVKRGICPGATVVIASRNHADQTVAVLACLFCGAIVAPVDFYIGHVDGEPQIRKLQPSMAFCDARCLTVIDKVCRDLKIKCMLVSFSNDSNIYFSHMCQKQSPDFEVYKEAYPRKACAFIIPSGGSTGAVRLVRISHYAMMHQVVCCRRLLLKDIKKFVSFFPLSYNMQSIFTCVCFNEPITKILPGPFNERNFFRLIHDLKIDSVILTPHYAAKLYNHPSMQDFDISCLKTIHLGGDLLCNALISELINRFVNAKLFVWYSCTEVGIISGMQIDDISEVLHSVVNCGQLYPDVVCRILHFKTRKTVKSNAHGEILLKSPGMMLGYQEQALNEKFFEDGFFKTGDVGFYDKKGSLYVRGRIDQMIFRQDDMFPAVEIEDIIMKHPHVEDTVVVSKDDAIIACVVKNEEGQSLTIEKLIKYVKDRAPMERRPTEIRFFEHFPKSTIGKIHRQFIMESLMNVGINHSTSSLSIPSTS